MLLLRMVQDRHRRSHRDDHFRRDPKSFGPQPVRQAVEILLGFASPRLQHLRFERHREGEGVPSAEDRLENVEEADVRLGDLREGLDRVEDGFVTLSAAAHIVNARA